MYLFKHINTSMTKRASFYIIGFLFVLILGGWFAYEKYWEYRVKEGAKDLGYELNDEEVRYFVAGNKHSSYTLLDKLANDESAEVRYKVADNENAPEILLNKLAED